MIVQEVCGSPIKVKCIIELTFINEKTQTTLSGATNISQYCSVCGVSPKNMNSHFILKEIYTHREI